MKNYCRRCGIEIINGVTDLCSECKDKKNQNFNNGWVCSICGKSLSPNLITCPFCKTQIESGTYQGKTILME